MIEHKHDEVAYYKSLIEKNWARVQKQKQGTAESRTAWSQYHHALQAAYNAGALQFPKQALGTAQPGPYDPIELIREADSLATVKAPHGLDVRFTWAKDDQEFWVHFKFSDGKAAAINLGNPSGMIATAALRALAGVTP